MADADRCPNCGARLPEQAPEGLCPRCLMPQALAEPTPRPDATVGSGVAAPGPEPGPTMADTSATRADPISSPPGDATGALSPDTGHSTQVADGNRPAPDLARGAAVRYFGDYEVQKELGRGGMGVVYRARQISLNRPVALKMIKTGVLADDAELRRFQNEAEAVALLDHAGIVPVYEVGEHNGQKYFSMKLVEGGNLAEGLLAFGRDFRAAATLAAEAAEAVHHAHMRGILHRDLKPANILIDAEGRPQVTDFGLAKRVEADSEMTATGAILGTPSYMSPEQAAGHRGAITTATDIHGLGSILYALLTGKAPFGGDSVLETLQAVKERAPNPPRRLNAGVPRDLEVIALKCLEKDPRRRYSSAQALADDLRRWLDGRPIAARPVGPAERAWLWCKREPVVAALTAAVVIAAVGGTAAVIAVQADANRVLTAKNTELAVEKTRVQQRFELAQAAIRMFHTGVSEDVLLKQKEFEALRTKLLRGARDFYGELENLLQGQNDRGSRQELGRAYLEVGELTHQIESSRAAVAVLRRAVELFGTLRREQPSDREARLGLGRAWCKFGSLLLTQDGSMAEAREALRIARETLEPLARSAPPDSQALLVLAEIYMLVGYDLSDRLHRPEEGLALSRKARDILEELAQADPADEALRETLANSYGNLGLDLGGRGLQDEANAAFARGRELLEGLVRAHPADARFGQELTRALGNMAVNLDERSGSKVGERIAIRQRIREICREMGRIHPTLLAFRANLAWTDLNQSGDLLQLGRDDEARPLLEESRTLREELIRANPNLTRYKSQLAEVLLCLRAVHARAGRPEEATALRGQALKIHRELVAANPDDHTLHNSLASSLTNTSQIIIRRGRAEATFAREAVAEAAEGFREAVAIRERLVREHPEVPLYRGHLAYSLRRLGHVERTLGDPAAAVARTRRAVVLLEAMSARADELWWELACGRAALAGLAAVPGSGLSPVEGLAEGDLAMAQLRQLVDARTNWFEEYRDDPALEALRDRRDFRLLLLDRAMPADPFASSPSSPSTRAPPRP